MPICAMWKIIIKLNYIIINFIYSYWSLYIQVLPSKISFDNLQIITYIQMVYCSLLIIHLPIVVSFTLQLTSDNNDD